MPLEQFVLEHVQHHFRRILCAARDDRALPAYRDLTTEEDRREWCLAFRVRFHDHDDYFWRIRHSQLIENDCYRSGRFDNAAFFNECRRIWSQLYEDELMRRQLAPRRARVMELARRGAPGHVIMAAQRDLEEFERHLRMHHREPPMVRMDFGRMTEIDMRPGAVNFLGSDPAAGRYQQALYEEFRRQSEVWINEAFYGRDVGDAKANERGMQLLKSWLTPEQRKTFENDGHFDVVGSASKKLYRVKEGRQQNVFELDGNNREICGWCFLPQGALVAGDVMLAQKIALETDERAALKIANRFADRRHHPERVRARHEWRGFTFIDDAVT
jgi:hypothetical protein